MRKGGGAPQLFACAPLRVGASPRAFVHSYQRRIFLADDVQQVVQSKSSGKHLSHQFERLTSCIEEHEGVIRAL